MSGRPVGGGVRRRLLPPLDIGSRPDDDPDLRVRKQVAVGAGYALIAASLFYTTLSLLADRPGVLAISLVQAVVQAALLLWFRRSGRIGPLVVSLMAVGLTTLAVGFVIFGGLLRSNGSLVFGLLTPVAAVLFLGRRAALPAYAAFAALVAWAVLTEPALRERPAPFPEELGLALYAMNALVSAAIALGMVVFVDGERVRAKRQAEGLLLNVLPRAIVDRLFTAFDRLAEERGLEKIKTIGDAYMVVAGVPSQLADHAEVLVDMALAMHRAAGEQPEINGRRLQLRTGIASGPVVAGIIGRQKFSYDLWGDTVNVAARMESSGVPGCIQVTPATWQRVANFYPWQVREGVEVKGKGPMRTYLLDPAALPGGAV
jgi:guanylate cyclase